MKVIAVAGQMQNGKDTAADYLKRKLIFTFGEDYTRTAFAASVKRVFSETFNVPLSFIEEWKVNPEPPPGFDMNVRQSLQFIGDGFRKIQANIWIDLAFLNRTDNLIFSDVRYINELKKIKSLNGITMLVWRPGFENNDPNGSEAQIKSVVDWFKEIYEDTGREGDVNNQLIWCKTGEWTRYKQAPEEAKYVDLFLVNQGTKEDFYEKIDRLVVPYVRDKWYKSQSVC